MQILPIAVVSPLYFAGTIQLGVVTQTTGAFNHILNDLSLIVNSFESLSAFSAGVDRLSEFLNAIKGADRSRSEVNGDVLSLEQKEEVEDESDDSRITTKIASPASILSSKHLTVRTPDLSRSLIPNLSFSLPPNSNLLITGTSGT